MKSYLAMVLATAALALSIWHAVMRLRSAGPQAAEPARLAPLPTSATADCGTPAAMTSLAGLMRKQINSTMTRVSFALYHDQRDPAARFETVADNAARLLGCIHLMPNLPPEEIGIAGLPDYFRLLGSMQESALGLRIAALEQDADGARHWFGHLKQDCVACHSRFRVDAGREAALK